MTQKLAEEVKTLTYSEFAEENFLLKGKPLSLKNREYLMPIWNEYFPFSQRTVLVAGRQVEKSSSIALKSLAIIMLEPYYQILYVTHFMGQAREFSSERVEDIIRQTPLLKHAASYPRNVFKKKFKNGASITIQYSAKDVNRIRGISADMLAIDEIELSAVEELPVIEETLSHADEAAGMKRQLYTGTPLSSNTPLSYYHDISSQCEWMIKCRHCINWNYCDENIIGDKSLICNKCGKVIFPRDGQWVSFNKDGKWAGFRLSQLMVPWVKIYSDSGDSTSIKYKQKHYSRQKFTNEVLGLPYDEGVLPITEAELRKNCQPDVPMKQPGEIGYTTVAGVDWGLGEQKTVLTIARIIPSKAAEILYIHKFEGGESTITQQPARITEICRSMGVQVIGADFGFGAYQNRILREKDWPNRVLEIVSTGNLREIIKFDKKGQKFIIDRNELIRIFYNMLHKEGRKVKLFRWEEFKQFIPDFQSLTLEAVEHSGIERAIYTSRPDRPNDAFFSTMYAVITAHWFFEILPDLVAYR